MKTFTPDTKLVHAFAELYRDIKLRTANWQHKLIVLTTLTNGRPLHIILADDDEDDREHFIEAIHFISPHIKVTTEPDGTSLMKALKDMGNNVPDIIFLDLNMPFKNGFECLDEIRTNSTLRPVPVIVYSTSSNKDLINVTYDKGANLYIEKPQSFREIKIVLQKLFALEQEEYFQQPPISKFILRAG